MAKNAIMKINKYDSKEGILELCVNDSNIKTMLSGLTDLCNKKHGGYVKLEMSPPYKKRSISENSKWWAMCTEYANYCGSTREEVSMGIKWRAVDEGLWDTVTMPFTNHREPKSTAQSNTFEMSVLIDVLYRVASEDGYVFKT